MGSRLQQLLAPLSHLSPVGIIDILIVAFLLYQFLAIIRGRRAAHILNGILVLLLIYIVAVVSGMELLSTLLAALAPYAPIALLIMFQSEIRRMLARLGRNPWFGVGKQLQRRESAQEILLAVQQLSNSHTGALIVMERDIGLRTFIESGVMLDATVSRELLLSVFEHKAALHDGAAIIQGDRIAAAACFLPLSTNPLVMRKLGTRHRAAIGVTEETDSLAIVVSEETGSISTASGGEIDLDIDLPTLNDKIIAHFGRRKARPSRKAVPAPVPAAPERERVEHT